MSSFFTDKTDSLRNDIYNLQKFLFSFFNG